MKTNRGAKENNQDRAGDQVDRADPAGDPGERSYRGQLVEVVTAPPAPPPEPVADPAALPDDPPLGLDPVTATATATSEQIAGALELRLQLVGALAGAAIAEAWDIGRIAKPDPSRPPFADEVGGL